MGVKPLTVAFVAAALFAVTVGVDASMNRAYALDVQVDDGWREIGRVPGAYDDRHGYLGQTEVEVNASDAITFRLRVHNDNLLPLRETWRAYANGFEVASDEVALRAGTEGEFIFSAPTSRFLSGYGPRGGNEEIIFASVEVRVGDDHVYGQFGIREVQTS